jgi:hypothetical protein
LIMLGFAGAEVWRESWLWGGNSHRTGPLVSPGPRRPTGWAAHARARPPLPVKMAVFQSTEAAATPPLEDLPLVLRRDRRSGQPGWDRCWCALACGRACPIGQFSTRRTRRLHGGTRSLPGPAARESYRRHLEKSGTSRKAQRSFPPWSSVVPSCSPCRQCRGKHAPVLSPSARNFTEATRPGSPPAITPIRNDPPPPQAASPAPCTGPVPRRANARTRRPGRAGGRRYGAAGPAHARDHREWR